MSELIKTAKLFANSSHKRIAVYRNPAWQSIKVHLRAVAQMVFLWLPKTSPALNQVIWAPCRR